MITQFESLIMSPGVHYGNISQPSDDCSQSITAIKILTGYTLVREFLQDFWLELVKGAKIRVVWVCGCWGVGECFVLV